MLFPKEKITHTKTYQGNLNEDGWLVLNISNVELDGVNKIYIDLSDIDNIKAKSGKEAEALKHMKELLGGDSDI